MNNVISVALKKSPNAHHSVVLKRDGSLEENSKIASNKLTAIMGKEKVHAIFCVAGGWVGGNAADEEFPTKVALTYSQSVQSSVSAVQLANMFLHPDGILVLTGAAAAMNPTPNMLAYGMAKCAVHYLARTLASPDAGIVGTSIAILPVTLDTPKNRLAMPDGNFDDWTPPEHLARIFYQWIDDPSIVKNGSLYKVITKNGVTELQEAEIMQDPE
ncbi:hypothetical protein HMI56_007664 [Coelomomyces lativittatus]|nr:hypothetical protein HMI56_007664 [Coelomomyces lativittatus]